MKTLADLKRKLVPGQKVMMVRHDWYPGNKLMNAERTVVSVNNVGVSISVPNEDHSSGMDWPKSRNLHFTDDGFEVALDSSKGLEGPRMGYKFIN
ncbi:hypothetical protein [Methylobacillus sp.]|uniref:hypothetical protein n=1 Tax=Methylobacillus sp. TaxID=56818 RepID=UPI0012C02EA5|nr:hypothetical protein [Methylobacillus sp.]MPS48519.1 hypothetical protein [Methylobacillus sp.]